MTTKILRVMVVSYEYTFRCNLPYLYYKVTTSGNVFAGGGAAALALWHCSKHFSFFREQDLISN